MGIETEYTPDLALRNFEEFMKGNRNKQECIPEKLEVGNIYEFLKKGQRIFWLQGELPLLETKGNQELSAPLASIIILEATHHKFNGEVWTKGKYKVTEVFDTASIRFNGFAKIQ